MRFRPRKPKEDLGLIVAPNGNIIRENVTIESTVLWGQPNESLGRPAWLTPNALRQSHAGSFTILPVSFLTSVTFPGERQNVTTNEKLSKAMSEQYNRRVYLSTIKDNVVMIIAIIVTMTFLSIALSGSALLMTYQNTRGGDENVPQVVDRRIPD